MLAAVAGCGGRASHANAGATSGGASSLGGASAGASGGASSLGGASAGATSGGGSSPDGSESATACPRAYGASWGFASSATGTGGTGGAVASDLQGNVAYVVDQTGIVSRDATGTMRWAQALLNGATLPVTPMAPETDGGLFAGTVSAIAPAGDGGFFIVGETPLDSAETAFVSRLDSQGGISWTQVLSGLNGPPFYVVFDGSNQLWVLGVGIAPSTDPIGSTFASLALLGADGRVVWQQRFGDPPSHIRPVGLALTSDGHAVIALRVDGGSISIADPKADATANRGLVASFNADGTRAWSRAIGQDPTDNISGLTVGADGTIYAAGFTVRGGPSSTTILDPFLVALAEDGTVRWRRTYSLDAYANEPMLAARPCGGLVIAANTEMRTNSFPLGTLLIDVDDSGQEQRVRHIANAYGTIAAHGSDGIVLVGQLFGNLTFDSVQLSATGIGGNAFVARFLE